MIVNVKRCYAFLCFLCGFATISLAEIYSGHCGENGDNLTWTLDSETGELIISGEGRMYDFAKRDFENTWWDHGHEYLTDYIESIKIGNKVTNIGGYAFQCMPNLKHIEIGNSVQEIGDYAFAACDGLTSVTIPNSVTNICWQAFFSCSNLCKVTLGNSIVNIGESVFTNCINLREINFPNSLKQIGRVAFGHCALTKIKLPNSLTSIGDLAFTDCEELNNFIIPNSVTNIGYCAFQNCRTLTSIEIPNSVTSIGESICAGCPNIVSIKVGKDNSVYDSREDCNAIIYKSIPGFPNDSIESILIQGCSKTRIPQSVTSIGEHAFEGCTTLTSIELPMGLTSIGDYAFEGCSNLVQMKIPNSVISIGEWAFSGCTGLKNIVIPNSVTYIGSWAFNHCSSLDGIEIPESVRWLGDNFNDIFNECSELTHIIMRPIEPPYLDYTYGGNIFEGCNKLFVIYVPSGSKEMYNIYPYYRYSIVELAEEKQVDEYQGKLNKELRCLVDSLRNALYKNPLHDDTFSNHGILHSENQLSTNKQEPTEGPIINLLDGDFNTFFHSTWSEENFDDKNHYIQVDFNKEVSSFTLKYTKRNYVFNDSPLKIRLFATNDLETPWNEIGVIKCLYNEDYFDWYNSGGTSIIELGENYRHIRMVVEATYLGSTNNGNLFFSWSEIGLWENIIEDNLTCSENIVKDIQADLYTAWLEINNLTATQETIDKIRKDLNVLSGDETTQVDNLLSNDENLGNTHFDIYTISGSLISKRTNNLNNIPKGIYVIRSGNSSKVILK